MRLQNVTRFTLFLFPLSGTLLAGQVADPLVSEDVRLIAGAGPSVANYHLRAVAARELGLRLEPRDVEYLFLFLDKKLKDDALRPSELNGIKNDVVTMLLRQEQPPESLVGHLLNGFRSDSSDEAWRDYCLQFLPKAHATFARSETREKILQTLWEATEEKKSTFAGTALLGLRTIKNVTPDAVDVEQLEDRAFEIARDPAVSMPSRISAIQVCGDEAAAMDFVRAIAIDPSANALLRASAIAKLGRSPSDADRRLLEGLATAADVRLRIAARAALEG